MKVFSSICPTIIPWHPAMPLIPPLEPTCSATFLIHLTVPIDCMLTACLWKWHGWKSGKLCLNQDKQELLVLLHSSCQSHHHRRLLHWSGIILALKIQSDYSYSFCSAQYAWKSISGEFTPSPFQTWRWSWPVCSFLDPNFSLPFLKIRVTFAFCHCSGTPLSTKSLWPSKDNRQYPYNYIH